MRALRSTFPLLAALASGCASVPAQAPAAPTAAPPTAAASPTPAEREVRQLVDRLFDGMRAGDSTVVRSAFHPQARLQTTGMRQGAPVLQNGSIDDFVRAVGTPHPEVWDERIANVEVRVDDNLATAWMDYAFYTGDTFSHCGVNAFQFFRGEEGWRIIQITDTRRRECPRMGGGASAP